MAALFRQSGASDLLALAHALLALLAAELYRHLLMAGIAHDRIHNAIQTMLAAASST